MIAPARWLDAPFDFDDSEERGPDGRWIGSGGKTSGADKAESKMPTERVAKGRDGGKAESANDVRTLLNQGLPKDEYEAQEASLWESSRLVAARMPADEKTTFDLAKLSQGGEPVGKLALTSKGMWQSEESEGRTAWYYVGQVKDASEEVRAKAAAGEDGWRLGDDPKVQGDLREQGVNYMLNMWLESSTSLDISAAIQDGARAEFGLTARPVESEVGQKAVDKITREFGLTLQAFARAQYDETQSQLKAAGISSVTLYRGMNNGYGVDDPFDDEPPDELPADQLPSWWNDSTAVNPEMNPLSSFTSEVNQARAFASLGSEGRVLSATLPASQILSTGRSGMGAVSQSEFIVLAGGGTYDVERPGTTASALARWSTDTPFDFDESEPRDPEGKWIGSGGGKTSGAGKAKGAGKAAGAKKAGAAKSANKTSGGTKTSGSKKVGASKATGKLKINPKLKENFKAGAKKAGGKTSAVKAAGAKQAGGNKRLAQAKEHKANGTYASKPPVKMTDPQLHQWIRDELKKDPTLTKVQAQMIARRVDRISVTPKRFGDAYTQVKSGGEEKPVGAAKAEVPKPTAMPDKIDKERTTGKVVSGQAAIHLTNGGSAAKPYGKEPEELKAKVASRVAAAMGPKYQVALTAIGARWSANGSQYNGREITPGTAKEALGPKGVWVRDKPYSKYEDPDDNPWVYMGKEGAKGIKSVEEYRSAAKGWDDRQFRRGDDPQLQKMVREQGVSLLISRWAGTSNDHDPTALALQEAAVKEFGLKDTQGWKMPKPLAGRVAAELGKNEGLYRTFLRTQYTLTQHDLKGVKSVTLYRGFKDPKQGHGGSKAMTATPKWWDSKEDAVPLRPMSSFAASKHEAELFSSPYSGGGRVISADIPANLIFSTPQSGFGCSDESEMVVLGHGRTFEIEGKPLKAGKHGKHGWTTWTGEAPFDFNPEEPRDATGKWEGGGGGSTGGGSKPGGDKTGGAPKTADGKNARLEEAKAHRTAGTYANKPVQKLTDPQLHDWIRKELKGDPSLTKVQAQMIARRVERISVTPKRFGEAYAHVTGKAVAAKPTGASKPSGASKPAGKAAPEPSKSLTAKEYVDRPTQAIGKAQAGTVAQKFLTAGLNTKGGSGKQALWAAREEAKREVASTLERAMGKEHTAALAAIGAGGGHFSYGNSGVESLPKEALTAKGFWSRPASGNSKYGMHFESGPWRYEGKTRPAASTSINVRPGNDPDLQKDLRRQGVSRLVSQWAQTSNDHSALSLAIQEAAKDEFKLHGSSAPWLMADKGLAEATKTLYEKNGDTLRAFVRAQYDTTQKKLAGAGITTLRLYRGQTTLPKGEQRTSPGGAKLLADPELRPMSSFSSARSESKKFAGWGPKVFSAAVPASRIVATPRSGVGCLNEREFVVLAGSGDYELLAPGQKKSKFAVDLDMPFDYNESEERGPDGRWTGGGASKAEGAKKAGGATKAQGAKTEQTIATKASTTEQKPAGGKTSGLREPVKSGKTLYGSEAVTMMTVKDDTTGKPLSAPQLKASVASLVASRMGAEHTEGLARFGSVYDRGPTRQDNILPDQEHVVDHQGVWGRPPSGGKPGTGPWRYLGPAEAYKVPNDEQVRSWELKRGDDPQLQRAVREQGVSKLVGLWAATSNDSNSDALAMQEIAQSEFGLRSAMGWQTSDAANDKVVDSMMQHGDMMAAFLRAQYAETQDMLRAQGVKSVELFRGFKDPADEGFGRPAWWDAQLAKGPGTEIAGKSLYAEMSLRPMSSFSADVSTAAEFAMGENEFGEEIDGRVIASSVPVERIIGTPLSGVGCRDEYEFVVLDGPGTYTVHDPAGAMHEYGDH